MVPRAGARPARLPRAGVRHGAADISLNLGVAERRGISRGSYRGSRGCSHARRRAKIRRLDFMRSRPRRGVRGRNERAPPPARRSLGDRFRRPRLCRTPSPPKPRAPARSRRHFGGAPQGPGGALSAAAGPRRVDVPVRAEDFELSAAVARTPGAEPEPYGAQRKPWGPPAPRRAFRRVVPQTLGGRARKAGAPNFGARPTTRCLPHVSCTGRPRTAPRGRWAARGQPPARYPAELPQIAVFSPSRAAIWVSRPI